VADLTDLNIVLIEPDSTLFPNLPDGIQVHAGFAIEHQKTASLILTEVQNLMTEHSSKQVILVRLAFTTKMSIIQF
jgi:hypothetical protein